MTKVLLTGGSGLLGSHLEIEADRPTHQELDITESCKEGKTYDLIVHCAAYTDVQGAETDRMRCLEVNVNGTLNLLEAYPDTPFVFISSEYAFKPVNFYALTKSLAEQLVATHPNHLIIRTLFKPRPFPYPKAFVNQYTLGDYVDVIAPLIIQEIEKWDRKSKMVYIGTGRKSIYDLAKQTKNVEPIMVEEITAVKIPKDYL